MNFILQVAGNENGITAFQMDIKVKNINISTYALLLQDILF